MRFIMLLKQALERLGFKVSFISAQHVKLLVGRQKSDANDARAICEAYSRPMETTHSWSSTLQSFELASYGSLVTRDSGRNWSERRLWI